MTQCVRLPAYAARSGARPVDCFLHMGIMQLEAVMLAGTGHHSQGFSWEQPLLHQFLGCVLILGIKAFSLKLALPTNRQPRSDMEQAKPNWIASSSQGTSRVATSKSPRT